MDRAGQKFNLVGSLSMNFPSISVEHLLGRKRKREFPKFREALIEGYAIQAGWDKTDAVLLTSLMTARRIAIAGWLCSRSDNPRLKRYFRRAVREAIQNLKG